MSEFKFTKSHEWVKVEPDSATIGITDYAQSQLGDVVFVELPKPGGAIQQTKQFGTIESTKAASELYAPIDGEIVEANNNVVSNPQLVNQSAQDFGWLLKVKISDFSQLDSLMDEVAYQEFVAKESK
ncbi:MAG: glycine cleavage system protein GcvH [Candidatus Omnitrophica bacterium]|nr:glycine cleavage system protein GcvH [Candidatus Omnitrophota bacterium]